MICLFMAILGAVLIGLGLYLCLRSDRQGADALSEVLIGMATGLVGSALLFVAGLKWIFQ